MFQVNDLPVTHQRPEGTNEKGRETLEMIGAGISNITRHFKHI